MAGRTLERQLAIVLHFSVCAAVLYDATHLRDCLASIYREQHK
jgi:hypothetical protein